MSDGRGASTSTSTSSHATPGTGTATATATGKEASSAYTVTRRRKKWAPKSKTGCLTCRRRHVKCDEGKPSCSNCTSLSLACAGYSRPPRGSVAVSLAPQPMVVPYPSVVKATGSDMVMFDMLRRETVSQITSGFYEHFWCVEVLRAAHVYPAVWHASLSLAAMHRRMSVVGDSDMAQSVRQGHYSFALAQYGSAMGYLLSAIQQPRRQVTYSSMEMVLLSTILFAGICGQMGDLREASVHARNGLRLYYQWRFRDTVDAMPRARLLQHGVLSSASIVTLMTYMDTQFLTVFSRTDAIERTPRLLRPSVQASPTLQAFESVTEAYFVLQDLFSMMMDLCTYRPKPGEGTTMYNWSESQPLYEAEFGVWNRRFDLLRQARDFHGLDRENLLLLDMFSTTFRIFLELGSGKDQRPRFAFIVEAAEKFCAMQTGRTKWPVTTPATESTLNKAPGSSNIVSSTRLPAQFFSFSLSVCEMAYFVATFSSDSALRRRVIAVLRGWPRTDGIWDSRITAAVLQTKLDMEEGRTSAGLEHMDKEEGGEKCECVSLGNVCNIHRIMRTSIEILQPGSARLSILTMGDIKYEREGQNIIVHV